MILADAVGIVSIEGRGDDAGVGGGMGVGEAALVAAVAGPRAASLESPAEEAALRPGVVVGGGASLVLLERGAAQEHPGRSGGGGL